MVGTVTWQDVNRPATPARLAELREKFTGYLACAPVAQLDLFKVAP
jgi:hypothetical protein